MLEIFGTLGPSCSDRETLKAMFYEGMSGVRLNLSHTSLEEAAGQIETLHEAAAECGVRAELLIDMQGPELRIGQIAEPLELKSGQIVCLGEGGIPVPDICLPHMKRGQEILLDDGKLLLEAEDEGEGYVKARVKLGGILKGRKSIALPGTKIHPSALTESDKKNLALAPKFGVTAVMQPFVRSAEDLKELKAELKNAGGEGIRIFAKIENMEGVGALEAIIREADLIVIARGDLGNSLSLWELPGLQKHISEVCLQNGKPFMVVTQMLASMEHSPVPTRAEVSDIFNAVLDGASSIMVTGETAVGEYPVRVIEYMSKTAHEAEMYIAKRGIDYCSRF